MKASCCCAANSLHLVDYKLVDYKLVDYELAVFEIILIHPCFLSS